MSADLEFARECLAGGNDEGATASALVGILDLLAEHSRAETQDESHLSRKQRVSDTASILAAIGGREG